MPKSSEAQPQRRYHSPARSAAARRTRTRICKEAQRLFLANGYAATSMRSIAQAAHVAEKTVYLQFATKIDLLKEVVETTIVGDDEHVAASERQWFRDILDEPERDRKLSLLADAAAALHERTGAVFAMARGAADADPDAAALWAFGKQGHRADMGRIAENLQTSGMLPYGQTRERALQVLYVLIGPEAWHLVRQELGEDPAGYRSWLGQALSQAFGAATAEE